jgi:hypothetical protein
MVLHTDQPHPHVHLVVKAMSEQGQRLNIRKATAREWRHCSGSVGRATIRGARGVDAFDQRVRPPGRRLLEKRSAEGVRCIAVEASVTDIWHKYIRLERAVLGIDRFGESAPAGDLFKYFDFTVGTFVAQVKSVLFTCFSIGIRDYPN